MAAKGNQDMNKEKKESVGSLRDQTMLEVHSICTAGWKEYIMIFFQQIYDFIRRVVSCNISGYLWLVKNPITIFFYTHTQKQEYLLP